MTGKSTQHTRNTFGRPVYAIPTVPAPSGTRCVKVNIPDDDEHEAIFLGALATLTRWYNWQRDEDKNATLAAECWKSALYDNPTFEECDMPVQFRQLESCILEFSIDGGTTWDIAYDGSSCVREGIVDAIQDGTVSPGGQQPGGGEGVLGQCYTYHVKLDGNGRWQSPIPVVQGDIVTVSNVQGAWYDGAAYPVGPWNCADGLIFALGACGGSTSTQGTDPAPAIAHMKLIGNCAAEATPFFDMYNTAYTLTGSATPTDFFLQPNDSVLADNQGSITFDVEICKAGWCVMWDFRVGTYGPWTISYGANGGANGVVNNTGLGFPYTAQIQATILAAWNVYRIEFGLWNQAPDVTAFRGTQHPPGTLFPFAGGTGMAGDWTANEGLTIGSDTVMQVNNSNNSNAGNVRIKWVKLQGRGTKPTSGIDCP